MSVLEFLNLQLFQIGNYSFTVRNIFLLVLCIVIARLLWWSSHKLLKGIYKQIDIEKPSQEMVDRFIRYVIYIITSIAALTSLGVPINDFLNVSLYATTNYNFTIGHIVNSLIMVALARPIYWVAQQLLTNFYKKGEYDVGTQFAINQIIKYIIYTIVLLSAIQLLGVKLTVIWGGAAALLVGFGLGLQQTFTDLISGIFMLIERGVHVGDILQVGDMVGKVEKIGLRASQIVTRENLVIVVPNSKLVTDSVINWSRNDNVVRHTIKVGVAYGSDTQLVKKILFETTDKHTGVLPSPRPNIRFVGFGDSSLDFEILFWSEEFTTIEDIKSDIRYKIDMEFRENKVTIPFPQRDLWIKNTADIGNVFQQRNIDIKK